MSGLVDKKAALDQTREEYFVQNGKFQSRKHWPFRISAVHRTARRSMKDTNFGIVKGAMTKESARCTSVFPERPKLRGLQANQDYKGSLQKAHWRVHDLNLFVTVQLREETLAVLSLGKLCEEHGYTYEWAGGQKKPHLTKQDNKILAKTENFVPLVVLELSSNSGTSSSSTSTPQDSSSTSSSLATERSDGQAPRNWCRSPSTPNRNLKRDDNEIRTTDCEIFLSVWRNSQVIERGQKCMLPHTFLRTQIRNVSRKR